MQTQHRSDHLIRHSLLLLVASQLTNIANTLFHVFMGRLLSPVEYGSLVAMLGLLMIFGTPLAALSNAVAFYSAQLLEENRPGAIRSFMRRWLKNILFICIGIVLLGIVFCPSATSFFNLQRPATFVLAIIIMSISLFGPVLGGILQGIQAFSWASVSSVCGGVFRLVFGVAFVYFFGRVADWGVIGHGIGLLVSLFISVGAVIWIFKDAATVASDKNVAGYFFGSLIVLAGFSVLMSADVLIVKHYFSPEESGLFARAATIGRMVIFLPMPIAGALFPKIVAAGDYGVKHKKLLMRGTFLAAGIIIAAVAAGSLIPQLPLWILYRDLHPTETMLRLVRCMFWAMSPLSLVFIIMNYHMAQSRFKVLFFLPLCAFLYLAGATIWHATVFQIIAVMAACNSVALIILFAGLPWRGFKPAESGSAPAVY